MKLPKKIAIIGAGPSGLFFAERLLALAKEQHKSIEITLFEKNSRVGGKCYSYQSKNHPGLITEVGAAAVAANYGVVIDAMKAHQVEFEYMLKSDEQGFELLDEYKNASLMSGLSMAGSLIKELKEFNAEYSLYQQAKENKVPLADYLEQPFDTLCEKYNWQYLPMLEKPFVPGFGYGDLRQIPAYSVLEYMGRTTLLSMVANSVLLKRPPLLGIKNGFQYLLEQMANKHRVELETRITKIDRYEDDVIINYTQQQESMTERFDCVVMANSPHNWKSLGMPLTKIENDCVNNLSYYRYPVAVVKIKGLPNKQYFFPDALVNEGFGRLALVTTRDDRTAPQDGRLCTIYVNQPPKSCDFDFKKSWPEIVNELKTIEGVSDIELIEEQYWEDYLPSLPWELRLELEQQQYASDTKTIYLGAYTLGAFEDVLSVANKAYNLANTLFAKKLAPIENFSYKEFSRATLFYGSANKPYSDDKQQEKEMRGCTIL